MRSLFRIALALTLWSSAPYVLADPINAVPYASLTGTGLITFDDIAGGPAPGVNYNGILSSGGASFAERFLGQTLSFNGNFDVLSGTPVGPLSLQAGAAGQNLNVFDFSTNVLNGLGPLGYPDFEAIGEGSMAVLFVFDQSQFGFQLVGGNGGSATLNFFRRDGSVIQSIVVNNLADAFYGFQRDGNVKDIAGVSIHNNDVGGIGLDNLKHDVPAPVSEPSTLVLLSVGVVTGAARRWIGQRRL
jgi:hypothetical protein